MCERLSRGSSAAAEHGTMLHERAVTGDVSDLNEFDMRCVTTVREKILEIVQEEETEEILFEKQYAWHFELELMTFGTIDCIIIQKTRIVIIDFKFGKWAVEPAPNNTQVQIYGGMVYDEHIGMMSEKFVLACIHQPTILGGGWSEYGMGQGETEAIKNKVIWAYNDCPANNTQIHLNPNPAKQCFFCPARGNCYALDAMEKVTDVTVYGGSRDVIAGTQLGIIWDKIKTSGVEGRLAAIHDQAKAAAEEGNLPGWTIREEKGRTKFKDVQAFYASIATFNGHTYPVERFLAFTDIKGLAKLETDYARWLKEVYEQYNPGEKTTIKAGKQEFQNRAGDIIKAARGKAVRKMVRV